MMTLDEAMSQVGDAFMCAYGRADFPALAVLRDYLSQPQPVAQGEAVDGEAFIIKYEDTDEPDEVFIGYGARELAFKRYEQRSTAWSAHLFQRIHCNTDRAPMPTATTTIPTGHRVVPDGWEVKAAAWLRDKAEKQRKTNTEYPEHAKAYPTWESFVIKFEMLADELLAASPSAGGV